MSRNGKDTAKPSRASRYFAFLAAVGTGLITS